MVKKLYKPLSEPFPPESRLPPDLHFQVGLWTWTLEDDPFEVQLAALFKFKEKDYWDRQIRRNMLIQKLDKIRVEQSAKHDCPPITDEQYAEWFDELERSNTKEFITRIRKRKAGKDRIRHRLYASCLIV